MPFIETKAKSEYKIIDGKKTHVITPECEITLTNIETGREYFSDKELNSKSISSIVKVDNPVNSCAIYYFYPFPPLPQHPSS